MTDILTQIAANKRREVDAEERIEGPVTFPADLPDVTSMSRALLTSPTGIIAEFKRRSPSKGEIHAKAIAADVIPAYEAAGAAACSVLTDTPFFGGAPSDLMVAASLVNIPLLRKDFVVSERQILKARIYGASAVLLIASLLTADEISRFTTTAHDCGLEVLVELHSERELDRLTPAADMVGINNRDLTTFHTDPSLSERLAAMLPAEMVKVAESGLTNFGEVQRLRKLGFRGFLIGETFMKHDNPGEALSKFINGTL
ncbi:MAG: indole-3-glycerol phosphate synthase TrpC [Candidatus Amulumruptor caecigallinarius]|nr:indole-3-glycerol phosphate synthase TrpC [Candidatus Amulumruptor caecigallinarius]MCM1397278.1 indole-3-glycerol phosphate synthase TrpC [Candidatus Amulumruptor caecigallinarius]MCM1453657.1 indole-3-glycerol phosphate synthase TrpC [bacterium]